jgi:hypothetical protein
MVIEAGCHLSTNIKQECQGVCVTDPIDVGSPLADHCDWTLVYGAAPDHFGWINTVDIQFFQRPTANTPENLAYKNYKSVDGMLSGGYHDPGGTTDWTLPFAKFIDNLNIIGARVNNGVIELVERRNGTWNTIKSGGTNLNGFWKVVITETDIMVYVDDVLQIESTHRIPDRGYFGISGHKWASAEGTYITNFKVTQINYVTHGNERVTYNQKDVYYIK